MTTISLIIPTMNRPNSLKRTLESYFNNMCEVFPDELIVVDQSKSDIDKHNNEKIVETFRNVCDVNYLYLDEPSITKARNLATQICKGDILVYSDDDINVDYSTLKNVKELFLKNNISMIGGIDKFTNLKSSIAGYFIGTRSLIKKKKGHVTKSVLGRFPNRIKGEVNTEWAMGFFFSVKRELLRKWNIKFDENLTSYAYAEDLDFTYSYYKKSKSEGYNCIFSDKVVVEHLATKEYRIPSSKSINMYILNRAYICYKHKMGRTSAIFMHWTNFWIKMSNFFNREQYIYYKEAIGREKKYRNLLKKGILLPEFYS